MAWSRVRLQDELVGDVRLTLYLLWGVVGVVLLIACANTATLLLGKATARTREIAVRTALGARRGRIVRQLITESLLLALVAGAAGILLAFWGARALVALSPAAVVRGAESRIDGSVLAFTFVVSLGTSLLFGLVPALHASKVDLVDAVKQGGARSVVGGRMVRTRGVLVVSEIALAVVLLIGAGLLIKSLVALHNTDLGFQPENVLVIKATGVRSREDNNLFFGRIMSRMATLPGIAVVGATSNPPGDFSNAGTGAHFVDRMPEQRDRTRETADAHDHRCAGLVRRVGHSAEERPRFHRGRHRRPASRGHRQRGARSDIVCRRESDRQDDLSAASIGESGMTIVGVAGDVRQRNPAIVPMPECYMPYRQHSYNNATLNVVARTAGDPTDLAETVRRAAAEVSPEVPLSFSTMEARVSKSVEDPRFRALLFGIFASLAVCLAMAGVYGVMAFGVQQRSREIGLRMALGASQASVLRLILEQGLLFTAAGLAVGLGAAVAAARLLDDRPLRGSTSRHSGVSGCGCPAGAGDVDGRLSSGATCGDDGSGGGSPGGVREGWRDRA